MKSIVLVILIQLFCIVNVFSQIPNGAKKTIHYKVAQENRVYISKGQAVLLADSSRWSNVMMTNGALVEFAFGHLTLGATFLTDFHKDGGTDKMDLDLGYEFYITKSQILQPFIGYEFNENGHGFTVGAKFNKNFDLFEHISFGVFCGLRYSMSSDVFILDSNEFLGSDYLSASIGMFCFLYDYKRPKIIRDW